MSATNGDAGKGGQTIDVTDLDIPQLQDVRRQLEQELQHLTQSFGQLKAAQTKFKTCIESIEGMKPDAADKISLIPLTPSLYLPGKLTDPSTVIVDIGTGYYVEKPVAEAKKMYAEKVEIVNKSLEQLQETITRKQDNARVVTDIMQVKIMQAQQQGAGAQRQAVSS